MAEPTQLLAGKVAPFVDVALRRLDAALVEALDDAIAQGVPQGLIVGLLHAHAFQQTQRLMEDAA